MTAYNTALDALARHRITVCIPGLDNGTPTVSTQSWPVNPTTAPYILNPDRRTRAVALLAACRTARVQARQHGMLVP